MTGVDDTLGHVPWTWGFLPATKQQSLDLTQGQVASEHGPRFHLWVPTATRAAHPLHDLGQVT